VLLGKVDALRCPMLGSHGFGSLQQGQALCDAEVMGRFVQIDLEVEQSAFAERSKYVLEAVEKMRVTWK
jgi:hypothetical protein